MENHPKKIILPYFIVPTNARATKRQSTSTIKGSMREASQSKRMLLMVDLDEERDLPDFEESLSDSSDEDVALTTKHPLKAPLASSNQPLMMKKKRKVCFNGNCTDRKRALCVIIEL